jgi:CheY-like chemotaxis protein
MRTILFVEDEQRGVNPYFRCLQRKGFHCVLAKDGDEAVARLQEEKFDILSLDVMFDPGKTFADRVDPRRAGLHLLELIRQEKIPNCDPDLKVIVLTAVGNPQIEEIMMKKFGVLDYLKKPVPFDKVIETFMSVKP